MESGVSWKDICEDFRKCLEVPINENGLKAAYYTAVQNFLDDHLLTIIKHYNGNPEDTRKYIRETFDLYLSEIQLANFLKTYVQSQFVARTFELEELKTPVSNILEMETRSRYDKGVFARELKLSPTVDSKTVALRCGRTVHQSYTNWSYNLRHSLDDTKQLHGNLTFCIFGYKNVSKF